MKLYKLANYFFVFVILMTPFSFAWAEEAEDPYVSHEKAKQEYFNKNYEAALSQFQALAVVHPDNPYLRYNLGNTYFHLGQNGEAIRHYEKALRDLPRESDLKSNLMVARAKLVDKVQESFADYLTKTFYFWVPFITLSEYQVLLMFVSALFWLPFLFLTYRKRVSLKSVFLGAAVVFGYWGYGYHLKKEAVTPGNFGVVLKSEVDVRASYLESDNPLFELHEGTKVRIVDEQSFNENQKWLKIILPQGQKGWVLEGDIGII